MYLGVSKSRRAKSVDLINTGVARVLVSVGVVNEMEEMPVFHPVPSVPSVLLRSYSILSWRVKDGHIQAKT